MRLTKTIILVFFIALSGYAQDIFEVKFTVGITKYRCALVLNDDGSGKMRVRYYSNGETKMVEQSMRTEETKYGRRLAGYNPVYPGTSNTYSGYSPDNIYIAVDENGNYEAKNIDDRGVEAIVDIRSIEGSTAINSFLDDFNWELNDNGAKYKNIYFKNKCDRDIKLAIRYLDEDGDWVTKYWYQFDGDEGSYLSSGGIRLLTSNSIIYYYAESVYGSLIWAGEEARYFDGETYEMRETTMSVDSDDDYYFYVTCTND